ncbi:MAG: hypothetical protein U0736_01050 [Gemmataceae bacterium]
MPGLRDTAPDSPRLTRRWKADVGDHVIALEWSPTGKTLAAASVGGPVTLFDADGRVLHTLAGHGFGTASLSWRADGSLLATAGQDGKVRLWDTATGAELAAPVRRALPGSSTSAGHPSGDRLASAAGKKLKLWSADEAHLRDYPDHRATIADLAWRPGSGELTSATYGGAYVWPADAEPTHRLEWQGSVLKLAWSPRRQLPHAQPGRDGLTSAARHRGRTCRCRAIRSRYAS